MANSPTKSPSAVEASRAEPRGTPQNQSQKAPATPQSQVQKPTSTPLPRGADPAGQASSSRASQAASSGVARQGSPGASQQSGVRPSAEEIAKRAYERYQTRGQRDGNDQEDWYAAERELSGKAGGHN